MDWKRIFVSCIIASCIAYIILQALNDFGITWDEPIYFRSADRNVSWFREPTIADKDKFFKASTDDVHPPLRKLVAGITHEILTTQLKIVDNLKNINSSSYISIL